METDTFSAVQKWGPLMIVAGVSWSIAPAPIHFLEPRFINAVYVVPLAIMLISLYSLGEEIARDPVGLIGYLLSGIGMVVAGVGSVLEATLEVGTLAQWGLAEGQVFYLGLFIMFVGSAFMGTGLWRERRFVFAGPLLFLVLPATLVGFYGFNTIGMTDLNWIPITTPYGLAWVFLGWELGTFEEV
jgi:hypothetical protein